MTNKFYINGKEVSMHELAKAISYGLRKEYLQTGRKVPFEKEFPYLCQETPIKAYFEWTNLLHEDPYKNAWQKKFEVYDRYEVIYYSLKQAELTQVSRKIMDILNTKKDSLNESEHEYLIETLDKIVEKIKSIPLDADMIEAVGF
ncbi:MAG: hypothetical protein SPJ62_02605 [Inconstantimicrobium porci]|uniref:hypothetical protein n=1 Tax=Inconstantimicrobium porci TaxID=2652291 RepID=UPI002A9101C0|nr:hypothetical protein [Inconstantimicrobium porci]MDY5910905.1 hypothetical protein [Inconstantimicrobium porci]